MCVYHVRLFRLCLVLLCSRARSIVQIRCSPSQPNINYHLGGSKATSVLLVAIPFPYSPPAIMQPLTYVAAAIFLTGWLAFTIHRHRQAAKDKNSQYPMLPGPKLIPFIGRIHDLPIQYMWLKFKEWSDTFGPIYYTEMLGAKFVIISDEKIAEELLVKRARTNSDRPRMMSVTDSKSTDGGMEYLPLMGRNSKTRDVPLTYSADHITEYWARQRKFVHSYLTEASNAHYYGTLNHEAKRWLFRLLEEPDKHVASLEDMASKVMAQLTWDDPTVSEALGKSAWALLTQMSPAGPITNLITPLWHLPLPINPWKRAENKRHDEQSDWWMERYQHTKSLHANGQARPSWTRQYLDIEKNQPLSGDKEASAALGMLAIVGIFTVAGPLHYFLLSMVYHPEWQAKCQKEIDEVCRGEMPMLPDSPSLPILRACIKETMRWRPNVPTGETVKCEPRNSLTMANRCRTWDRGRRLLWRSIYPERNAHSSSRLVSSQDPPQYRPQLINLAKGIPPKSREISWPRQFPPGALARAGLANLPITLDSVSND